jgi:regulator of RNase E activity RraA
MKLVTNDEAWGVLEKPHGYHAQFTGDWLTLHPDLHAVVEAIGWREGRAGSQNTWVIDTLTPNNVLVVDLFGEVHDGGLRDLARVMELGDVALGTAEGVTFVPPHLAEEVVRRSEDVRQRDVFGKQRLAEQVYTSGQIDVPIWAEELEADYVRWCAEQGLSGPTR